MRPFDQVTLKTERLWLRPLVSSDADSLFGVFSDPQVMRYWGGPRWTSIDTAHERIRRDQTALPAGEYITLGIEVLGAGELIGECTLFSFMRQCKRAEVGYGLSSAFWGKGYMHEALTAVLDYGFKELDLHRVEADVDPRNAPSVRCLERLGFLKEGHLRERWIVEGEVSDTSLFGLLRRDWEAHRAPGGCTDGPPKHG